MPSYCVCMVFTVPCVVFVWCSKCHVLCLYGVQSAMCCVCVVFTVPCVVFVWCSQCHGGHTGGLPGSGPALRVGLQTLCGRHDQRGAVPGGEVVHTRTYAHTVVHTRTHTHTGSYTDKDAHTGSHTDKDAHTKSHTYTVQYPNIHTYRRQTGSCQQEQEKSSTGLRLGVILALLLIAPGSNSQ
jgi:hypothetical protein